MRPSGHAEDCGGPVTSCEDAYAPTLRRIHACVARSGEEGVRHVWRHGLMLGPGATILLGDNGSGKSTLVEAIAAAWARRITSFRSDWLQQMVATPSGEDSDLDRALRIAYTPGGCTGGMFLRAERLHAKAEAFSSRGRWAERITTPLLEQSHGEGFLQVLGGMTAEPGLYVLDEPEAALSFQGCLALLSIMIEMLEAGSQLILATHSPLLAALPGADLLQLTADGINPVTTYDDTDLVSSWRAFLRAPEAYLRHLR